MTRRSVQTWSSTEELEAVNREEHSKPYGEKKYLFDRDETSLQHSAKKGNFIAKNPFYPNDPKAAR